MDSTLESSLFEVSHSTTATKNLGFNDVSRGFKLVRNRECLFRRAGNVSERDSDLVGVEEGTGLVLVKFHATHRGGG